MSKLEKIFSLLQRFRLESYYNSFLELGVEDERDFIDSIDDETMTTLGLTQTEKKRFENMRAVIQKLGSVSKSMQSFQIKYTFPKCSEPKVISDIDPSQNTLDDLMFRIAMLENVGNDKAVCLYMACGVPLTDDPFFNTWSLKDRHMENGSELYAIFTPKENLRYAPQETGPRVDREIPGDDTVRCHVMLRGDYEIQLDLGQDKLRDLMRKLSKESGIPASVLRVRDVEGGPGQSLKDLEISGESAVHFSLSSFDSTYQDDLEFFMCDVNPSVRQTLKGMSTFFSTFYVICKTYFGTKLQKVIALIRRLTACNALAQAIYQLVYGEFGTRNQKIAIVEGLYLLFRELLPSKAKKTSPHIIEDTEVFENSNVCWAYLISQSENEKDEVCAPIRLTCDGSGKQLCEPVRVPGIPSVFDRVYVQDKIRKEEKIPACSERNLKETSIQRAIDIERILLSLPLSKNFPLWVSSSSGCNFQFNPEQTFDEMTEGVAKYSHLQACPPLSLLNLGVDGPGLLYIGKDNLGVHHARLKMDTPCVTVQDFLSGKVKTVNVRDLARELGDSRKDQTVQMNRVPEEAILVLVDASSSMTEMCYTSWKRMDAVKQLFDCFTDRTLAYNFHQAIGLIKFASDVKFHKFTQSLETFRTHVRGLEPQGATSLYDALNLGLSELLNVKQNFPNCRLRMLCLTDGNDYGSKCDPVEVVIKLIGANIVVDSILLTANQNKVLHGISNVTGGCCFKPETSKDALKLFEMETVLSLERRKLKRRHEASAVKSLADLTKIFQSCGYDEIPGVLHPEELSRKVTLPQNTLKKKILESKTGRFMRRDGRILEELKHLHVEPHPYCTVLPSEEDIGFWKILMKGPPNTPYANGSFELYCQFGEDYPLKPPLVRFFTPIYHCNVNSVGRICHNIFDRDYSAHVTMKEILEAVFGLLIVPEADDPLDSIVAEQFHASREKYDEDAQKSTEQAAATTIADLEKQLVGEDTSQAKIPPHLICKLSKRMFVDPVLTPHGYIYERGAIEDALTKRKVDPFSNEPLEVKDLKPNRDMRSMVKKFRESQIEETAL